MEFWGVEVKPGEPLKVQPEFGKLIHISQAALGEVKDVKGAKYVPLRLKIDAKSLVLGALSAEERTQLIFDLVFEREFELSHDWENGSVYFMGYIADDPVSDEEDFSDEFEEPMDALLTGNIKQNLGDVKDAKTAAVTKTGNKEDGLPVSEDEDDSESDSDDEMAFIKSAQEDFSDDSEEDSDDDVDGSSSSEEKEEQPKAQQTKKRPTAQKAPVLNKKAKTSTPNNTGDKTVHNAIRLPSKKPGKGPASNKSNEKNKKWNGHMS